MKLTLPLLNVLAVAIVRLLRTVIMRAASVLDENISSNPPRRQSGWSRSHGSRPRDIASDDPIERGRNPEIFRTQYIVVVASRSSFGYFGSIEGFEASLGILRTSASGIHTGVV